MKGEKNIIKKIRQSRRGLTFTLRNGLFGIGDRYRYVLDNKKKVIRIIPDAEGDMTVSRKKSGSGFVPLFDIRSSDVRKAAADSDYMEIELLNNEVIVHCYKEVAAERPEESFVLLKDILSDKVISIGDALCVETGRIILRRAAGGETLEYYDEVFKEMFASLPSSVQKGKRTKDDLRRVYDVVSLFSGAGILDYAFKGDDGRFRFVYGIDSDPDAVMTYEYNMGHHIHCGDIRNVKASDVPDADLVIGGVPCVGYSNANRSDTDTEQGEEKRLLVDDFVRIVKAKNPSVFVIENVPQLLTKSEGMYIGRVREGLQDYEISCKLVTDCEVGGYTIRKRAIVIGSRIGRIELPDIKCVTPKTVRDALEKVDESWFNWSDVTMPKPKTAEAMAYVRPGHNWRDIPKSVLDLPETTHSDRYRRLDPDKPSPTLPNWRKVVMMPPSGDRILNVSEAAALQGLPKEFHVLGKSLNSRQQQIGNAVPQAIGRFVRKYVLIALDRHFLSPSFT